MLKHIPVRFPTKDNLRDRVSEFTETSYPCSQQMEICIRDLMVDMLRLGFGEGWNEREKVGDEG
jgi:hypothetical protein